MNQILDALSRNPEYLIPLVLGSLGILAGILVPVSIQWRIVRTTEENNLLKQALLDRGLSASEVATIMNAGTSRYRRSQLACGPPEAAMPGKQPGARAC